MTEIGRRLRELRDAQGLNLQQLSERTGFTASFLSQLERGRCSISITSLDKIARELGVHISTFFPQVQNGRSVTRAGQRVEMRVEGSLLSYEKLSGDFPSRLMEAFLITILPGEIQDGEYRHEGEEFGYILRGALTVWVEGEEFVLGPGDTVHFPSTVPHMWQNRGAEPVVALWVNTHRIT